MQGAGESTLRLREQYTSELEDARRMLDEAVSRVVELEDALKKFEVEQHHCIHRKLRPPPRFVVPLKNRNRTARCTMRPRRYKLKKVNESSPSLSASYCVVMQPRQYCHGRKQQDVAVFRV